MTAENQNQGDLHEGPSQRSLSIHGDVDTSTIIQGDRNTINQGPSYYTTNVFGSFDANQFPARPSQQISQQEYRWRQVLVQNVKHYWIEGVLERSLHNQVLIELGLEERSQAVASPISGVEEFADETDKPFPAGTQAADIFDNLGVGRTLLILGEPGAGKTTVLLKLVQTLITRIGDDFSQPIPVVLNLSSWAKKRKPIAEWLVQDLYETFQISKALGTAWIKEEQLTLCLDGLDEVDAEHRNACVQALNHFLQTHGRTEVVVCSRIRDYEALSEQLRVRCAIYVQPLTEQQIERYLEKAGEQLSTLSTAFSQNPEIRALAASPLVLSVMSLAYQGHPLDDLPEVVNAEAFRRRLFDTYIERMFLRRGKTQSYTKKQAKHWLAWIAQCMTRTSQSIFLVEQLRPFYLQALPQKLAYKLLFGSIFGTFFGVIGGLNIAFAGEIFSDYTLDGGSPWLSATVFALVIGLIGGYLSGADMMDSPIQHPNSKEWNTSQIAFFFSLATLFLLGIPAGLLTGAVHGFAGFLLGPIVALPNALFGGLIGSLFGKSITTLKMTENLKWQWRYSVMGSLIFGLVFSLLFSFVYFFSGTPSEPDILSSVFRGIQAGLPTGCVLGAIASGVRGQEIETKIVANQGIRKSLMNAIMYGGLFGLAVASGISLLALGQSSNVLKAGFGAGALWGGIISLKMGGIACIHHFVTRLVLYQQHLIPWNYTRFLDYATERLFLQKVGGGYIFIHRMLLEHFAQMELEQKGAK